MLFNYIEFHFEILTKKKHPIFVALRARDLQK